jgi:hypothetical protein
LLNSLLPGWICQNAIVAFWGHHPVSSSAFQSPPSKAKSGSGHQRPQQALQLMIGSLVGMVQVGRLDQASGGFSPS